MLHACVQRFDVIGTVGNFLGTKQSLRNKKNQFQKSNEDDG